MADILIRGLKMPEGCIRCPFNDNYGNSIYYYCTINKLLGKPCEIEYSNNIDCPLHELPPHGDLIDRDRLMEDGWVLHKEVIRMGGYAIHELPLSNPGIPVIVPASEEGDHAE